MLTWLKLNAENKAQFDVALELAEKIFWQHPNLSAFKAVAQCAEKTADWDQKRSEILSRLAAEKQLTVLLEIYLDIKDVKSALSLWKEMESAKEHRGYTGSMRRELASSAEAEFPREAIDLYLKIVHSFIEQRKRQSYAEACHFLQKVKALYLRLEEQAVWDKFIADLRVQYRTLPALQEELKKAKL